MWQQAKFHSLIQFMAPKYILLLHLLMLSVFQLVTHGRVRRAIVQPQSQHLGQ